MRRERHLSALPPPADVPPPTKRKKLTKTQARKGWCFAKGARAAAAEEVDLGTETVECDPSWFSDAGGTDDEVGIRPHVRPCALLARVPVCLRMHAPCKHLLMSQPEFLAQKTALEESCEAAGHVVLMLPKCHLELNPIEQFWAAVKDCLRRVCGHTGPDLTKNVPESIRRVPLAQVQRCFRRAERFVALCRFEHENDLMLTGAVRDCATKICKRHQTVPDNLLQKLRLDVEHRQTKLEARLETGRGKAALVQAKLARVKAVSRAVCGAGGN